MANTIYVLNGPTLDLPGTEPETQGHATLADVEKLCGETAGRYGLGADCRQSGSEDELIDFIREAQAKKALGIVINGDSHSRGSAALHDALATARIPAVEVHISNLHARESFRHQAFTTRTAFASLSGFGIDGYRLAIASLAAKIGVKAAA
jgi:3-dehydroquinate dehydratase-2